MIFRKSLDGCQDFLRDQLLELIVTTLIAAVCAGRRTTNFLSNFTRPGSQ